MVRFAIRRFIAMVFVIIAISMITFLLLLGSGNQADRLAGKNATQAEIHQIEVKYGFNKPIYVQYVKTMGNIFSGQAYSYTQGLNVLTEVKRDFPATLSLAFGAGIIWLLVSIVIGTLAAVRAGRYTDRILRPTCFRWAATCR
jgi:peptide/nickel transport system permease protein